MTPLRQRMPNRPSVVPNRYCVGDQAVTKCQRNCDTSKLSHVDSLYVRFSHCCSDCTRFAIRRDDPRIRIPNLNKRE
jgi:hypothetical protein